MSDNGFPDGLRPAHWMGDVSSRLGQDKASTIPVTWFIYPGSHDCATYGQGLAEFSYQCQEKNIYDQMMAGNRAFDLRLAPAPEDNPHKFIPVHGIAKHTADDFNDNPREAKQNDIASQIMRFAREHPTEIIIIKVKFDGLDTDGHRLMFGNTMMNLLGERLLEIPSQDGVPRYQQAVESNRNIILATGLPNLKVGQPDHPIHKHCWSVGNPTDHWLGDGNERLWNEPTWQSGELAKVLESTETWMHNNSEACIARNKIWVAYLQLTPVLGSSIKNFLQDGGSVRPKDLALGGGFGTHGQFHGSNKQLRDSGVFQKPVWKNHASCLLYDFADTHTTGAIVAMNLSN